MNTVKSPTYAFHPQISHTSTVPLSQFNAYTSQYIILFHFLMELCGVFLFLFLFLVISLALKPYGSRGRIVKHSAMVSSLNLLLSSVKPWFQYCSKWNPVFVEERVCCSVAGACCFFNYGKLIALKDDKF